MGDSVQGQETTQIKLKIQKVPIKLGKFPLVQQDYSSLREIIVRDDAGAVG